MISLSNQDDFNYYLLTTFKSCFLALDIFVKA